ncbi:MAG: hypothetical protein HY331_15415 [Chloroflexi bacterium]|nr:hypothetical protein [Chloroflexota bacterium]
MLEDLDLNRIQDDGARQAIVRLLNLIEQLAAENRTLREEIQRLRDENNRLKGEQGKSAIKSNTPKPPPPPKHSSEDERRTPMLDRFYQFVREERLFCTTLAHLLMQQGDNASKFLALVKQRVPDHEMPEAAQAGTVQVYTEFTFLRDYWYGLGRDNATKRRLILEWLAKVPALAHYQGKTWPDSTSEFNELFMGPRGARPRPVCRS